MVYGADGVADTDGRAECDAEGRDVGLAVYVYALEVGDVVALYVRL
jgi:hypothetical protein